MENTDRLAALGLFDLRVPRYTSYPTAPVFDASVGAGFQAGCLARLDPGDPISVYVHIPFCERLCWFCACRTQGTSSLRPVEAYLSTVERELVSIRKRMPDGVAMAELHWGGGTPTILQPDQIRRLSDALRETFDTTGGFEFSVEIDPTSVDGDKIAALETAGMTRASIGIQDFLPEVQAAIGRKQSFEATRVCVDDLRQAGIRSLNTDLVYGLPYQTLRTLEATISKTVLLEPDRIALFGYAHVPWMSKRQKLIDAAALPDERMRYELSELAAEMLVDAGYERIGIDHFAKPADRLARAAGAGTLRRNFQGYTDDACETLIGIGASAMSRFRQGYVQNASATAAYVDRIEGLGLAGAKGHAFVGDDGLRAAVIEMIMCQSGVDMAVLRRSFGTDADALNAVNTEVISSFAPYVVPTSGGWRLRPDGRALTRIIASRYDAYSHGAAMFSKAS